MNTNLIFKRVWAAAALFLVPFMAFAAGTGTPTFSLLGAKDIQANAAIVSVSFSPGDALYYYGEEPVTVISYTNTASGISLVTAPVSEQRNNHITDFFLENLTLNTNYSYKAIMTYNGRTFETAARTFVTAPKTGTTSGVSSSVSTSTSTTTTSSSTNSGTVKNTSSSTGATSGLSFANIFKSSGTSKNSAMLQSIVKTGGYGFQNGVGLSITNSHARVVSGDTFDYVLQYSNGNSRTLRAARIMIQLPDQYTFASATDGSTVYTEGDNIVTVYIGSIGGNESGTVTFTARAIGPNNQAVKTRANLVYTGGSVSAIDTDTYVGGSQSVLGASVFGAGFFPQTFFGWLLVILILILLVIAARRYVVNHKK